jgi:hypothetical protein
MEPHRLNIPLERDNTIIEAVWFTNPTTGADCIGIVTVQTFDETKQYIGIGHGLNEEADAVRIAKFGSRYYKGIY